MLRNRHNINLRRPRQCLPRSDFLKIGSRFLGQQPTHDRSSPVAPSLIDPRGASPRHPRFTGVFCLRACPSPVVFFFRASIVLLFVALFGAHSRVVRDHRPICTRRSASRPRAGCSKSEPACTKLTRNFTCTRSSTTPAAPWMRCTSCYAGRILRTSNPGRGENPPWAGYLIQSNPIMVPMSPFIF